MSSVAIHFYLGLLYSGRVAYISEGAFRSSYIDYDSAFFLGPK